ncbi:hypothetical protein ASG11_09680 [Sphingomonas sp. Leaf357]|uniref:FitA-like ribbon-helix-helix domain-containing protein n=1 Tax=Sphingomonas sp. Leaf357 TaxID=1736350 RepID=UPI0006F9D54A|nr:hypothetical protein [Sphingomonas sp. Leaf357]KQS04483.1 hypothetical protein ASG11_09680 [Sphingomonas sp. Leaf357]
MGQVLIRNLDDALLDDYRRVAKEHGRSLEAELRDGLLRARPKRRLSKEELIALLREVQAMTPPGVTQSDSTAIIREMRDKGYGFSD